MRIDVFKRPYRTYTGAFCGKPHLDEGGKIILPASALDELARLNIVYPMLFKISNPKKKKHTHCGVLEFSAEEGRAYIPFWVSTYHHGIIIESNRDLYNVDQSTDARIPAIISWFYGKY